MFIVLGTSLPALASEQDVRTTGPRLLPVCVNDEGGVVDETGAILVAFSKSNNFIPLGHESVYAFVQQKHLGAKNRNGDVVAKPIFDALDYARPGYVGVMKAKGWGVINTQGKSIVPCEFDTFDHLPRAKVFSMGKGNGDALFDALGRRIREVGDAIQVAPVDSSDHSESDFDPWIKITNKVRISSI